jgi:C4-dicarboxylate-specific signal transduction histidine kinase
VTEKLRLESIAESVSTMDSIGYVFSGVRHEIGNPINSINAILTVLRMKLDTLSTDSVRTYLDRTIEQISRVEYILRSLKSFNLYETQELQNVPVRGFFESFLPLVEDDFAKRGTAIETVLDDGEGWAYTDPRALQQVLLNIITNAADAVAGRTGPKVTLRVRQSEGMVRIRVQDNGCGIPEEKLNDIFKPFYTTKEHGTGLGLVIVKKMLTKMKGTIAIDSRKDEGTTVEISIPPGTPASN